MRYPGGIAMSQEMQIFDYMVKGNGISAADAIELFGCYRLSARIKDLRDSGHEIRTHLEENVTRPGKHARYWLVEKK